MHRATRMLLICALLAGAVGIAAIVAGRFHASTPDLHEIAPSSAQTAPPRDASSIRVATLNASDARPVTLLVIARERDAFSIPCAAAASAQSLARTEVRDAAPVALAVPAGRELWLLASVADDEIARWGTALEPLAAGASIEIEVLFPETPARMQGVVLDRGSARPIAGASIEADEGSDAFRCMRASSGADGTFALPVPPAARAGALLRVRADGYAPVELAVAADGGARSRVRVELVGAARLAVSVQRSDGSPAPGIGVEVTPSAPPGLTAPPRISTGADGRCAFADLPAGSPLKVRLYRDARLLREEPELRALRPGERRALVIRLDGAHVRGRLVDQYGAPVAGAVVSIRSAAARGGRSDASPTAVEPGTDVQGRFDFEDIPPGSWLVAHTGVVVDSARRGAAPAFAFVSKRLEIPAGAREVDVTLVAYRDLFIAGEVVDPDGRPVEGAGVVALGSPQGEPHQVAATSDASGRFVLGPLGPTEYSVASRLRSVPVRARAGDTGVVVRLSPIGALRGVVLDARTGAPLRAEVRASNAASSTTYRVQSRSGPDGVFALDELPPGRWTLEAMTETGRGHLAELPLRAGETLENLELRVEEAAILEIVSAAVHARLSAVDARGRSVCQILATSAVSRCVVEPGRLTVREYAPAAGTTRDLEVSVRAGELRRVDFGLEPR
jgi:hypothetical protein